MDAKRAKLILLLTVLVFIIASMLCSCTDPEQEQIEQIEANQWWYDRQHQQANEMDCTLVRQYRHQRDSIILQQNERK